MYTAAMNRYDAMPYRRCGRSGLLLPAVCLGLWHGFGDKSDPQTAREMLLGAFDEGITHFDLANNYGPEPGAAERRFGDVLQSDLAAYRDELVISTKAGYAMWPGPYGEWGSRKNLLASLDQSLRRMRVDYVDIFYHHRPDPHTPLEESMGALADAVRQGKALYVGISNYGAEETRRAAGILRGMGVPLLIHQPNYSLLNRWVEDGLSQVLLEGGIGAIAYSPLAQGLLTDKYLHGIPGTSRAAGESVFLTPAAITEEKLRMIQRLDALAGQRGQGLAQMALAWVLHNPAVTSVLVGASSLAQIQENARAIRQSAGFTPAELSEIDAILGKMPNA